MASTQFTIIRLDANLDPISLQDKRFTVVRTSASGPAGAKGDKGDQGDLGPAGPDGPSAYQVAVAAGFGGSEEYWLLTLVGPQGEQGNQGPAGLDGLFTAASEAEILELTDDTKAVTPLGLSFYGPTLLAGADSLDDWYDGIDQEAAWYQEGTSGNYVSTPDHAAFDVTDVTVMWYGALADFTVGSTTQSLVGRWDGGTDRAWQMSLFGGSATLNFTYSTTGVNSGTKLSVNLSSFLSDGAGIWIAVTFDADDGSGNNVARGWICDTVPPGRIPNTDEWVLVGTDTDAGTVALNSSDLALEVGSSLSGTTTPAVGKHSRAVVCSDIGPAGVPGSTIIAEYDANIARGQRYRDSTGKVWTHTGSNWAMARR